MAISFNQVGVITGAVGGPNVISNPTSLQFGPDGRLYVSEQNGQINAFTVSIENGEYVATEHEELTLPGGAHVVQSIQNHNDDGSESGQSNRQVTGLVVTGTVDNPVLYVSSSDPRIATNNDTGLDTNSGVITRVTWTGTEWDAVDIVRGLPRSEENHSVNGLAFNPQDATKLYAMVGGNTNNGAPSGFFSYTGEYVLSGTMLEIDLDAIAAIETADGEKTDSNGRNYVYDLPTLDDPNVENLTDGVGEDDVGMDEDGPWGGNDGLNMAILPADAPLRVYADGFRNPYDVAFTADGRPYTVDNGSNGNLGDVPNTEAGDPDGDGQPGEAINTPNDGGSGDPEPFFFIEDGGYYGHPNPVRSNQNQSWTAYDNSGNPDGSLQNTVGDISARVPDAVNVQEGFLIDPSKFTGDPTRLFDSGVRVERSSAATNAIITTGSSTNGIVVYDSNGQAFDGYLDGKIFVTQFNDNITLFNLNATGDGLDPVPTEGADGIFGTADDGVDDADGVKFVANNSLGIPLGNPLDVTVGPNGTLWVAEIGANEVTVLAPSDVILPGDNDSDDDGLLNAVDPFLRDASNGTSVVVAPGVDTVWEFSQDASDLTPGPDGFGGGLTGHMIDGVTDFEAYLQESTGTTTIRLDNVKFVTAAGGGTTVIEEVSEGDPFQTPNNGEFLFHTGFTLAGNVDTFTVTWVVANPGAYTGGSDITNNFQQIGGYLGDGSQSNYLKIVAIATNDDATAASIQVQLEDGDATTQEISLAANDIFNNGTLVAGSTIVFELEIDPRAGTATPKATYSTTSGDVEVTGTQTIDLSDSAVLETILGNATVQGQSTGLAAGLFSSSFGSPSDTFQAIFDSITVTATEAQVPPDAVDDEAFTGIDTALNIPVDQLLANDTDANPADTLTVTGVDNPQNGTVSLDAGVVTFTPDPGYEGPASFDYTVSDGTFTDTATVSVSVADRVILYRVNAGGAEIASLDSGPAWSADNNPDSPNLIVAGSDSTAGFNVQPGPDVPDSVPAAIYQTERWDNAAAPEMQWGFDVAPGQYEVNLFMGNGFDGTSAAGQRVFDVAIEGSVLPNLDDIDLSADFGHLVGTVISNTVPVTDGQLNIEFLHGTENPLINGIEIVQVGTSVTPQDPVVSILNAVQSVPETGQAFISIATDITVPSGETVDVVFTIEPLGGATAGTGGDYEYTSSSATFGGSSYTDTKSIAGGSSDLQIPVSILEDTDIDPNEGFVLTITSVSGNATIGQNSVATVTIEDDDFAPGQVLYRINSGGAEVAATDGGPNWSADTSASPTPFLVAGGENTFASNIAFTVDPADVNGAPAAIFDNERWDELGTADDVGEMEYEFTGLASGDYTVNLYMVEGSSAQSAPGERVFDVAVEGDVPAVFDDITPFDTYGNAAFVLSHTQAVTDGTLDLDFLHGSANNPAIRGIEILAAGTALPVDSVNGVTVLGGDFSSDAANPNAVLLPAGGSTTIVSNLEGGHNDRDFITVTIPDGYRLADVILEGYQADPGNSGFLGLKLGGDFVVDPAIPALGITPDGVVEPGDLEGGYVFNDGDVGTDLLPKLNAPSFGFAGFDEDALTGDVTVWLNQGGDASQATLTFVTEEIPSTGGDIVAAINAGGGALTQGGIDFAADTGFLTGQAFADGNAGNGPQPVFDGTIYETERYGGAPGSAPLQYEIAVEPGEYTVELYFAEIFQSNPGTRVFDVSVEGQLVLDDFDILAQTNGDINQPIVFDVPGSFSPDAFGNANALDIDFTASVDNAKISAIVVREAGVEPEPTGGAATLTVNNNANGIETSNFNNNSFQITNVGTKDIAFIEINVTDAILPDAVFDPFGLAGDQTGKIFTLNNGSDGGTGLIEPADNNNEDGGFDEDAIGIVYLGDSGPNGTAGYERIRLEFNDFNQGESISFGVDMDPNSIAGAQKSTLDSGAPLDGAGVWDVGGIGGAELAGSLFSVGYADNTASTGQLHGQGAGSQMGAEALSTQDGDDLSVSLTVNGLGEGAEGTYGDGGPQILIQGPTGETARVLVAKGFIVPFTNEFPDTNGDAFDPDNVYHDRLDQQLQALEASGFPANNMVEMQYVDVPLDGTLQDISNFPGLDFSQVAAFDLSVPDQTNEFGTLVESQLPLGIVASVIDTSNDQPKGPVTSPIHLTFAENAAPTIDPIADINIDEGQDATFAIAASDLEGDDITLSVAVTRDSDGTTVDPSAYTFTDNDDGTGSFAWATGEPDDGAYTVTVTADDGTSQSTETLALIINEVADPQPGTVLFRVNAGGAEAAAADGGPAWTADTQDDNSPFLANPGSNDDFPTNGDPNLNVDLSPLPAGTGAVAEMIGIERWDNTDDANGEMAWAFDVTAGTEVTVNLYLAELFTGIPDIDGSGDPTGDRIFDVSVDGAVPAAFDDLDPYSLAGSAFATASVVSHTLVSDGTVDLEFLHVSENPAIKGIEIVVAGEPDLDAPTAALNAAGVTAADSTYEFSVTFADDSGVDVSTIDGLDITVSNGALSFETEATLVTVDDPADGSPRTATYAITPPGGGWDPADNGIYTVTLNDGQVADTLGNAAGATLLGTFEVNVPEANAGALIEITPGGGLGASTFSGSSFQITNTGEPGVQITSFSIDLSTGILPDMVFDPTGAGGDATASGFTPSAGAAATGLVVPIDPFVDPFSQPRNGGFDIITVGFTDFDPGEKFDFTTDVDPNSIQGVPGAGNAGAVSGYELTGSTVTVTFSNGETVTGSLFEDGSLGGSQAVIESAAPAAPTIEVLGAGADESTLNGTQVTVSADPTVRVTGTGGDYVALLQMDSRLFIASGNPPFDGAVSDDGLPFYANEAMSGKVIYTGQIGADGIVDIPVTLLATDGGTTPDGGLNQFIAVTSAIPYAVDQATSQTSNVLTVREGVALVYDEPGVMTFDGTDSTVIELPPNPDWAIPAGTVAFSFNATDTSGDQGLVSRDASGFVGGGNHFAIYLDGDQLIARFQDGSASAELSFNGIAAGTEYEVAATFGPGGVGLWIDGNLVATDPLLMDWTTNGEYLQWGGRGWASSAGAPGFDASFEGTISDKQIYAGVLTASQIAVLAANASGINTPPLAVPDTIEVAEDGSVNFDPAANDSDGDGQAVSVSLIATDPANGTAMIETDGTVTYTPDGDFNGSDQFEVTVTDGAGGFANSLVDVTVTPVDDDPQAINDAAVAQVGTTVTIDLVANDVDVDGDPLSIIAIGATSDGGFVVNNNDGTVDYTAPSATGTDTFTYTIDDGNGGPTSIATVTVELLAQPNLAPLAVDDTGTLEEDTSLVIDPLANDTDAEDDPLSIVGIVSGPSNGTFDIATSTYTPEADFNGLDSFVYEITDGFLTDQATVTLTVNPLNDPPVAVDDGASTTAEAGVIIDVLGNDTDADGDALSVTSAIDPANGSVEVNPNGTITYTPDAGFAGPDSFDYTVTDGQESATATVTVDVTSFPTPVFDAPGATAFDGTNSGVDEIEPDPIYQFSAGTVAFSFTAADTSGAQGLFTRDASGFAGDGNHLAIYLNGSTLIARFQNGDGNGNSVSLQVPEIVPGVEYDIAATFGPDGSRLYVDGELAAQNPLVMDWNENVEFIQWGGRGWGSQTGQAGFDAPFEGTIADRQIYDVALTADQVAELQADGPPNADPVAVDDAIVTDEDVAISFDPTLNDSDIDGDVLEAQSVASGPSNGTATVAANGQVTYTPDTDFFGADSFDIVVGDGNGGFDTSTVTVTINGIEDDPVAVDDAAGVQSGGSVVIDVLANDSDGDGDTLEVASFDAASAESGAVRLNADGTLTYTSPDGFTGSDTFLYVLSDGAGATDTGNVTIQVSSTPVLPTPIFEQDGVSTYGGPSSDVDNYAPDTALNIAEGTIAFSFVDGNPSSRQGLIVKDASGFAGGGNHFAAYIESGDLKVRFQDDAESATLSFDIAANTEYEVAAVFDAGGVSLYVDGALAGQSDLVMEWTSNNEWLQVGGLGWGSATGEDSFTNPFSGEIADVQIFDEALNGDEIGILAASSSFDSFAMA
jgi:hypothetical protein